MSLLSNKIANERVINMCNIKNCTLVNINFKYIGSNKTILKLRCNIDKHKWKVKYHSFIDSKNGCPKCGNRVLPTQKEVDKNIIKRCHEINCILLEPFIYKTLKSKIKLECNIDGHKWNPTYQNFIKMKNGCPKCGKTIRFSQEEIEKLINEKCRKINCYLLESFKYINTKTKFKLKCNIDEHEWKTNYESFIRLNSGCPKCSNVARMTQQEVELKVGEICLEKKYTLIEPFIYKNTKTKFHLKCDIDNHKWKVNYNNFVNSGKGCPVCGIKKQNNNMIKKYGELWLNYMPHYNPNSIIYLDIISKKLNITILHALNGGEKKFRRYWVDGYIEKYNICIEWNEKLHYTRKYIEKDLIRENYINNNFSCYFIKINEKEFLKDVDNQINIVVDKIKQLISEIELTKNNTL